MSATSSAGPPQPVSVDANGTPDALKAIPRWVVWRYVEDVDPDTGEVDYDKPPVNAHTGGAASSTNPKTWTTFAEALAAYQRGGLDGIGFVLVRKKGEDGKEESGGLVGVDLDHCRDPKTGAIQAWAQEIVRELDTYTEVSPSGTAVRLFLYADLPPTGRKRGDFECYQTARYVTVTGAHVEGTPTTVEKRQPQMQRVHARIFGDKREAKNATPRAPGAMALDDAELIRRASKAKRGAGERFTRLWRGEIAGHNSPSAADLALCNYLAFWCGPDEDRIADLFAQSGLYRSKWNREDYRHRTIAKALSGRTEFYTPREGTGGNGLGSQESNGHAQRRATPKDEAREAEDDPHRLARLYVADHTTNAGRKLQWWRDDFHRWDGQAYRLLPDKEVKADLSERVKREFDERNRDVLRVWEEAGKKAEPPTARKVTVRLVSDVFQALQGMTVVPGTVQQPAWIGDDPFGAAEVLACRNGLVHLPSWADGRDYLRPLTPRLFSPNALDYDFDPNAAAPRNWLGFLEQLWEDDRQAVDALQEWFGYCQLPDTSQHKILMLVGPKRSGKGTIARVLSRTVGLANVCGPTLASLGTNFGLWPLLGKTLAIVSDARLSARTDAAAVVERLLSISGEDAQTIDRKHKAHVTVTLPARFVILTNELPRLNDPSGALVGRLVLLRLTRSWYGKENTELTSKLLAELPSILLWAMEGWKRLRARGYFVQPDSAKALVADMEDLSSPIGAFIRDCCEVGPGYEAFVDDLYSRWKAWAEAEGHKEPGIKPVFGRNLRAALPSIDLKQRRLRGGRIVRLYHGLRLKDDNATDETPFE